MKLGIYAIAKDEAKHVERFLKALLPELRPGDSITICDTGSTDSTLKELRQFAYARMDVHVHSITISPWRFDDARNASLALVPTDVDMAWCLDLDELPQPGWREGIEKAWGEGVTRLRYPFIWNWQPDGSPGIRYHADKLHARHGFRWKHPCHEVLVYEGEELVAFTDDVVIHHRADDSKSRSNYLPLMEKALKEDPTDNRMQFYYGRELYHYGRFEEARLWMRRYLANPRSTWADERSQAMIFICWARGGWQWILRAAAEAPHRREPWYRLAAWELECGNLELAYGYAKTAANLPATVSFIESPEVMGDGPDRLVSEIANAMRKEQDAPVPEVADLGVGDAGGGGAEHGTVHPDSVHAAGQAEAG